MSPDWRVHENLIAARMQGSPRKDIVCKVRRSPARPTARLSFSTLIQSQQPKKDLHPRVARAVHSPRDPVSCYVHGTRASPSNAPHLPALAYGGRAGPRVFADTGAPANQR
jgi:hypothetical protein